MYRLGQCMSEVDGRVVWSVNEALRNAASGRVDVLLSLPLPVPTVLDSLSVLFLTGVSKE